MKEYIILFFKGIAVGAANVIPGVSGGTIALLTGIFEKLINSIKSFDIVALKYLFTGRFREFVEYTNFYFLLALFLGVGTSIFSLAILFEYILNNDKYDIYLWAFFFGLLLASVYFVGKTISRLTWQVVLTFIVGTAIAFYITQLDPASRDTAFWYLILCGVVAICSMILPGISGSFVLMLMGNYIVVLESIGDINLKILVPVFIGIVIGLLAFSHLLSWVFDRFKDQTISLLTGFILGSVYIVWPWKSPKYLCYEGTNTEVLTSNGQPIIAGYENYHIPKEFNSEFFIAFAIIIIGVLTLWILEKLSEPEKKPKTNSEYSGFDSI